MTGSYLKCCGSAQKLLGNVFMGPEVDKKDIGSLQEMLRKCLEVNLKFLSVTGNLLEMFRK